MNAALELVFELVVTTLFVGMASLTAAWALLRKLTPRLAVLLGTMTIVLLTTALFLATQLGQKQDIWSLFHGYFTPERFDQHWKNYTQMMSQTGLLQGDKLESFREAYQKYFYWSLPAWLVIRCLIEGLLAYYIASSVFSRVTSRVPKPVPFRDWIVPEPLIFGLILAGLLKVFAPENGWIEILGDNLLVLFLGLFSLGGLSVMAFFFGKWNLWIPWRILCYLLVFLIGFDMVYCLGVLDVWFDFRKIKTPPVVPAA